MGKGGRQVHALNDATKTQNQSAGYHNVAIPAATQPLLCHNTVTAIVSCTSPPHI